MGRLEPFKAFAEIYKRDGVLGADGVKYGFYDPLIYELMFPKGNDAIFKMLKVWSIRRLYIEESYLCVDSISISNFLEYLEEFGVEIS